MKRGAPIIAEYLGGAVNCDAYHMTDPRADGLGVSSCIESSLEDAGVSPEEVFSFPPPHKLIFLLHGALFFLGIIFLESCLNGIWFQLSCLSSNTFALLLYLPPYSLSLSLMQKLYLICFISFLFVCGSLHACMHTLFCTYLVAIVTNCICRPSIVSYSIMR
jgi:hypothetical protein